MGYVTQQRLGRGAMGVVDLALDDDGRPVALKHLVLHGSRGDMEAARQRLRREAQALGSLDHPHVVGLLDVVDRGDEVVLVMPYLAGGTLTDRVRAGGPLPPAEVEALASDLLDALACAHRQGIVHRDIKPANVLFDEGGRAHLADFGVASVRDATSGLTVAGSVIGTPEFMAPEQARGERATTASDVFALGATLLYAATGQAPWGTGDPRVLVQRAAQGRLAPLPADLDPGLRRRLGPLLRRNPARRPSAAGAAGGPAGTAVLAGGAGAGSGRTWALAGASVAAVAVVGALVAVLAASGLGWSWGSGGGGEGAQPEVPPPAACTDLPYQPCGQPGAPGTDGHACLPGLADYDGDRANGCEASPTDVPGRVFDEAITTANLVPGDDVDRYPTPVAVERNLLCTNELVIGLTAPAGTSMRLRVLDQDDDVLATAVSTDLEEARVTLTAGGLDCWLGGDDVELVTEVSWEGTARSAAPYRLARSGSF